MKPFSVSADITATVFCVIIMVREKWGAVSIGLRQGVRKAAFAEINEEFLNKRQLKPYGWSLRIGSGNLGISAKHC